MSTNDDLAAKAAEQCLAIDAHHIGDEVAAMAVVIREAYAPAMAVVEATVRFTEADEAWLALGHVQSKPGDQDFNNRMDVAAETRELRASAVFAAVREMRKLDAAGGSDA